MSPRRLPAARTLPAPRIPLTVLVGASLLAMLVASLGVVRTAQAQPAPSSLRLLHAAAGPKLVVKQASGRKTARPLRVKDQPAAGIVYAGLTQDPRCVGGVGIQDDPSADHCSHGPDPAPAGVDVRHVPTTQELLQATAAEAAGESEVAGTLAGTTTSGTAGAVQCYGTGSDGKRVEAIYAVAADRTDRFTSVAPLIAGYAANADKAFADSAAATGGVRHLRWLTSPDCKLVVDHVVLSATGDDNLANTKSELRSLGFTRSDRKYLVWTDAGVYCGISNVVGDDTPGLTNKNNVGPTFGRVDAGCWGQRASVEAHEIMHTLGSVQLSAPHSNRNWHCTDEYDRMCYDDGSGATLTYPCPALNELVFDCGHDDYFNTNPAAGSYLATHWNTANNEFLATTNGAAATATVSPSASPVPTTPSATPTPTHSATTTSPAPSPSPTLTTSPPPAAPAPTSSSGTLTTTSTGKLASWSGQVGPRRLKKFYFRVAEAGRVTITLSDSRPGDSHRFTLLSGRTTIGSALSAPTATWTGQLKAGRYEVQLRGPSSFQLTVSQSP